MRDENLDPTSISGLARVSIKRKRMDHQIRWISVHINIEEGIHVQYKIIDNAGIWLLVERIWRPWQANQINQIQFHLKGNIS